MFPFMRSGRPVFGFVPVLMFVLMATLARAAPQEKPEIPHIEVSKSVRAFLGLVNLASEATLRHAPGLKPDVVEKILKHRAEGRMFHDILEFRRVTGITTVDSQVALQPYLSIDQARSTLARRHPPARGAPPRDGRQEPGSTHVRDLDSPTPPVASQAAATLIGNVRPGFYGKLPGYEHLDALDPLVKKEFLETVNREMCTCGCKNDTLARCLVNDPGCPIVRARVRKIYDDILKHSSK